MEDSETMECQDMRLCGPAGRIPRVGPVSRVPRTGVALPCFVPGGMPVRTVNGRSPDSRGDVALTLSDLRGVDYSAIAESIEAATGRRLVVVDAGVDWTGASVNPVRNGAVAAAIAARYSKPAGGIPASDLAPGVTSLLNGALQMTPEALYALLAGKSDKSDTYTAVQADAAIAAAIAAVVNAAPAAFDTLKEIADWIQDDQSGAAAMASAIANKVDKVPGKGLSTNDYDATEKGKVATALQPADIDSTLSAQNKAADAKATGDALAGKLSKAEAEAGFTEWEYAGLPGDATGVQLRLTDHFWQLTFTSGGSGYLGMDLSHSSPDDTSLSFTCDSELGYPLLQVTATRVRLPTMADIPTKTSDLVNDSGFITQHQRLTPIYSQTPTYTWTFAPNSYGGNPIHMVYGPSDTEVSPWAGAENVGSTDDVEEWWGDATISRRWQGGGEDWEGEGDLVATGVRTDIVGYMLGSQVTKLLQPQGDYAPASALHYALVSPAVDYSTTDDENDTADVTLQDRASNAVTLGSGVAYATFTLPAKTTGKMRDFFLRLTLTGTVAPTVSFVEPGGGAPDFDVADDSWADFEPGVNVVCFTETSQA